MTRNDVGQRITSHGRADGTGRAGLSNCPGQRAVAGELAGRNLKQRSPHTHLKRRSLHEGAQWRTTLALPDSLKIRAAMVLAILASCLKTARGHCPFKASMGSRSS